MALSEKKHHTSMGHRKDTGCRVGGWVGGGGEGVRDALHGQVPGAPTPPSGALPVVTRKSPGVPSTILSG